MWSNQSGGFGYDQGGFGGGGDQGGGYMNSPGQFGSPGQASQERRSRQKAQNLMPCTVSQLLNCTQTDDKFVIGAVELHQVTLVGLVRSVQASSTRIDYEVDDMTGPPLQVKQFVEDDDNLSEEERSKPIMENTYVRVCGHIRSFGGKRNVAAFKMLPLTDMNELTMHLLEVVHSHMTMSIGQSNKASGSSSGMPARGGGQQHDYPGAQQDEGLHGLNPVQRQVQTLIRNAVGEQGINVNQISDQLRGVPEKAIRDAIEFLSSEGHIYSTIDEEHYRSTDAMD